MAMHPEIEKNLDKIKAIAERYGVDRLEIFGSAMTDAFDPARSDVDFIVHYPKGYDFGHFLERLFSMEADLAETVGYPAQMVMTSALKKDYFRQNADLTRATIYESVGSEPVVMNLATGYPSSSDVTAKIPA